MRLSDFDYHLPPELIAQYPIPARSDSRLLAVEAAPGGLRDLHFKQLPTLLRAGDLLVFNDTRVMQARLFGRKATGGRLELLVERVLQPRLALVHLRSNRSPALGTSILLGQAGVEAEVRERRGDLFLLHLAQGNFFGLMEREGHMPLPPYIERADQPVDQSRYQTVYATRPGAVAAPTAGLHFDPALLAQLAAMGVGSAHLTLHVGAGTFQPVREENLDAHVMHSEAMQLDERVCRQVREARAAGGRIVAVGTTSVRSLETAAAEGELKPYRGESRLFIRPGYRFRCVDAMITNFHLPRSTLMMLVAAFSGLETIKHAYAHAVDRRYRFFSYGDAMFLTRQAP